MEQRKFDIFIFNTTIVDGTGRPAYQGSVGIKNGRIKSIIFGKKDKIDSKKIIDGKNLILAPGFIDIHSHPDISMHSNPTCDNYIHQGITTAVGANCGLSSSLDYNKESFSEYLDRTQELGLSINYAPLVAFGPIRTKVLQDDFRRPANPDEIQKMKKYVEKAMQSGAYGMSTGLDYDPQEFASTNEIIELAKVVACYEGYYSTHHYHIQDQWGIGNKQEIGYGVFHGPIEDGWFGIYRGLLQAIEIGEKANIPVEISHIGNVFKILQPHPKFLDTAAAKATLEVIKQARNKGLDITIDTFPNNLSICGPRTILSEFIYSRMEKMQWLKEYSKKELIDNFKSPNFRKKIIELDKNHKLKFSMIHTRINPFWFHYFTIVSSKNHSYEQKTIAQLIKNSSNPQQNPLEFIMDLMIEDPDITWIQNVDTRLMGSIAEEFIKYEYCMPITDMMVLPPISSTIKMMIEQIKKTNENVGIIDEEQIKILTNVPGYYGLFPDYIHNYVKKKKILTIEKAIYKISGLPAWRAAIHDRGIILEDKSADLVLFDLNDIKSSSTLKNVRAYPTGIKYVIVNGKIVLNEGKHNQNRPGIVLKRTIN